MDFSNLAFLAPDGITPAAYANLSGWWDAAALGYADATPIDNSTKKFTDRSSNANHLFQATAGNQPQLKTGIINGKAVVRFDGAADPNNDKLTLTNTLTFVNAAAFTIIVVGLVNADSLFFGYSASNIQIRRYQSSGETMSFFDGAGAISSSTLATAHNAVHMMTWRRVATVGSFTFRENKTNRTSGSPTSGFTVTLDRMGITSSVFSQLNGDVCEAVIYSAFRTDAEIDALYDGYFKAKWGLP